MVGVTGGSKGCKTCRQRRVKCTEEKPVCSRCVRGGFVCHGYTRETAWHHLTTRSSSTEGSMDAPSTTLGRLVVLGSRKLETRDVRSAARSSVPPPPTQISLTGFQEDVCFAYIFSNFVWRGYGTSWLYQSAQGLLGQLAFDSVTALAEINFGKSQKSYQTEVQGRLKYGKALRCMITRLEVQRKDGLSELVIPILLLLMHATTLTSRPAAMFHLQAMTQILSACGPQKFQHQPLRDAFRAARATMVVASLVMGKRVFLDSPDWHEGPYTLMPQSKTPQSYLLDILASVPGLLQEFNEHEQMVDSTPFRQHASAHSYPSSNREIGGTSQMDLVHRVMIQLKSLFVWRLQWQVAFGSYVHAEPVVHNSILEPYISKLVFSSSTAASDIALYNAVLVWLLGLMTELEPLRAYSIAQDCACQAMLSMSDTKLSFTSKQGTALAGVPLFEPLRGIGSITKIRDAALEICRVFEWQSRNHASSANWEANFVYMFPISLAFCVLDTELEHCAWIRAMLDTNALTKDYGTLRAVDGESVYRTDNMDSSLSDENVDIGATGGIHKEKGLLHRLQKFGWFVTRELAGDSCAQAAPDPNIVHLLLLRGRADIAS